MKKWRNFLLNPAAEYTILSIAASAVNFLTLIIFGRVFPVRDYGIITTMQAFLANAAVLFTPLQMMVCRLLAGDGRTPKLSNLVSIFAAINAAELLIMMIGAYPVCRYLHFTEAAEYGLFVLLIFSNNVYLAVCGVAQGRQDFILLGWIGVVLYGVKMVLSVFLGLCGFGPLAAITGYFIAELACLLVMVKRLRPVIREVLAGCRFQISMEAVKSYLWMTCLYFAVSLYMNNGDLLLINLYNSEEAAGLYSVAINLSKISVFLIATPMATLLLPKIASHAGDPKTQLRFLLQAEMITLSVSIAYGIAFCMLGGRIIGVLHGEAYAAAKEYILPCVIFSTILSGFWVFYQYALASDLMKRFAVITAALGAVTVIGIVGTRCAAGTIPLVMASAMVGTVVIVIVAGRKRA